jgi:hypothetical protein
VGPLCELTAECWASISGSPCSTGFTWCKVQNGHNGGSLLGTDCNVSGSGMVAFYSSMARDVISLCTSIIVSQCNFLPYGVSHGV